MAYLVSFVSIPTLVLYTGVHEPNFIVGPGPDTPVLIDGVLEMIVALAGLVSAVALYPIVKWQNQGMALGLVGTRTIEGAVIVVGRCEQTLTGSIGDSAGGALHSRFVPLWTHPEPLHSKRLCGVS